MESKEKRGKDQRWKKGGNVKAKKEGVGHVAGHRKKKMRQ
jgi:hypothetical protein